jgi:hypothetical protein
MRGREETMNKNLKALGAKFQNQELHAVPSVSCLHAQDKNYGCITLIPAVTESGKHVVLVNDYGFVHSVKTKLTDVLAALAAHSGYAVSEDAVSPDGWTPVSRVQRLMAEAEACLRAEGFGDDPLAAQSLARVNPDEVRKLDMPVGDRTVWAETLARGLNNQNAAVVMGLNFACENARCESFNVYKMLRGTDSFGYPLPFMVSRVAVEGPIAHLSDVAKTVLSKRFGEGLKRCYVTEEDGKCILEYAVCVSDAAVKAIVEHTYPLFEANPSDDCIRVVEFTLSQPLSTDQKSELRAALQVSAAAVSCEFGEQAVRIGFPSYRGVPEDKSESLRQRAEFVKSCVGADIVQGASVVAVLDLTPQVEAQAAAGTYRRLANVAATDFTHSRITGMRKQSSSLENTFLGKSSTGEWYVESVVDGHVLAVGERDGVVKFGYMVKKGFTEQADAATADVHQLLSLVA